MKDVQRKLDLSLEARPSFHGVSWPSNSAIKLFDGPVFTHKKLACEIGMHYPSRNRLKVHVFHLMVQPCSTFFLPGRVRFLYFCQDLVEESKTNGGGGANMSSRMLLDIENHHF